MERAREGVGEWTAARGRGAGEGGGGMAGARRRSEGVRELLFFLVEQHSVSVEADMPRLFLPASTPSGPPEHAASEHKANREILLEDAGAGAGMERGAKGAGDGRRPGPGDGDGYRGGSFCFA